MTRIAIIGAGAKAAAIVARAAVLRDAGVKKIPDILVYEADDIGGAWSGKGSFSSGFLTLCTPGEKDIGFPYNETQPRRGAKRAIGPELFARFSWPAYLVAKGRFADWVDRGRDHPNHSEWADYLKWVFERAAQPVSFKEVTGIQEINGNWQVLLKNEVVQQNLFDGVVLTGAGHAKAVICSPDVPKERVFDSKTFWAYRDSIADLEEDGTIVVAGDGGAAGTIVAWLAGRFAEREVSIISVSPMGTLFPRGDGHAERRWFSDPSDWPQLSTDHRRKLLDHTEAGVVSMRNKQQIDLSPRVTYQWGKAVEAKWNGREIEVDVEYNGSAILRLPTDYLISAIGFDQWSLLKLVQDPSVSSLCAPGGASRRRQTELEMLDDLTLPPVSGLPPGLHVPGLAGLARGPGMGNLGCLGLMAAAVLERYIK